MLKETFNELLAIEKKAREVVSAAEKEKLQLIEAARKSAEAANQEALRSARVEARSMIEKSRKEAEAEKVEIERLNSGELSVLRKNITPLLAKAKQICL
ncbi:MAG: hypothetical protein ABIH50_08230 [bacterium]